MGKTFSNIVAITNNATGDTESAAGTIAVTPKAVITKIIVQDLTVGHTYAVVINFPSIVTPQRYVVPSNGAAASNGGKLVAQPFIIECRIPVPDGISNVSVSTFADTASATVEVGLVWELGNSEQTTHSDFTATTAAGTSETKIGSINVTAGKTIKRIVVASRLGVGVLKNVRLDFSGIEAPQKYCACPLIYDAMGTEVQNAAIFGVPPIECEVPIPSNTSSIDIYGTSQTASNTVAVGLIWV